MSFENWLSLSEAERKIERQTWQPYEDGYWHMLNAEAARRFQVEFGTIPQIRRMTSGTFHFGLLIIGVSTNLWEPDHLPLPDTYLGFRVIQFCAGDLPDSYRPSAA
jgi:hypothetical protein